MAPLYCARKLHAGIKRIGAMQREILNTGVRMPLLGLGTYQTRGADVVRATIDAMLRSGYRSIDTAGGYHNEGDIGTALKELLPKYGLKREDVFITSKLPPRDQGSGKCHKSCLATLERLQTDYLDMYLIHWPGTQKMKHDDVRNAVNRRESWIEMETLVNEGRLLGIGVSNYTERHLEELLGHCTLKPAVLQVEFHPHLNQKKLLDYCKKNDIHLQAYSSLGSMTPDNKLLADPIVTDIAGKTHKTSAQVLLRWAVQQGIGVIPKSTNIDHIRTNAEIFDFSLSEENMESLNALDYKQHHYCWDPNTIA